MHRSHNLETKQPVVALKQAIHKKLPKKKISRASKKMIRRSSYINPETYLAARAHSALESHFSLMRKSDEKGVDLKSVIQLSRSTIRGFFGSNELLIATGGRTGVATNGASVMVFSLPTGQGINMNLSATTFPEITAIISLFDEVKVAGIHVEYNPVNPYNRGAVTVSVPIALFFDDEDGTLAPTNTLAGQAAQVNRGRQFVEFSPDHSLKHTFTRMSPLSQYDWTPTSALGTEPSTLGSLYVTGDGTNTASITYGVMIYRALLHVRMRN